MPTRILLVGAGGREHALAWKLAAEPGVNEVIVAPGSAGIATEPRVRLASVDPLDPAGVVAAARSAAVELVVIGPEAPLAAGVADALRAAGVPVFGPTAAAARIETSKAFCHEVAAAAGVRMARARSFAAGEADAARDFARELGERDDDGLVVKADGLAAGKGVTVCETAAEADAALDDIFATGRADRASAEPVVVVEERLRGPEVSVIALCDGRDALVLPAARDHKRLLEGDAGPNTGGMGAYSPLPDLPDDDAAALVDSIHRPILAELGRRGTPFVGALYAGLILTADGPVLLECNARFGDPEAQVLLPRLGLALGPLLLAAARGNLVEAARPLGLDRAIPAMPMATVGIVLAASGYPGRPRTDDRITGLERAAATGALVFHGATAAADDSWATAGGRVVTVVGRGADLAEARDLAERGAAVISFDGSQRRGDIAAPVLTGAGRRR